MSSTELAKEWFIVHVNLICLYSPSLNSHPAVGITNRAMNRFYLRSIITTGFNLIKMPLKTDEAFRLVHLLRQVQQVKLLNYTQKQQRK